MSIFKDLFKKLAGDSPNAAPQTAPAPKPQEPDWKHMEIRSTEDAKALFLALFYEKNYAIERYCDEKTAAGYEAHSTSELRKQWATEKCEEQLRQLANGDTAQHHEYMVQILNAAEYYGIGILPKELLMQAWDAIWEREKPTAWLVARMRFYLERTSGKDEWIYRWMDHAIPYVRENFPEDWKRGASYGDYLYNFLDAVKQLRGFRLELRETDCGAFRLVRASDAVLNTIFDHYHEKLGGDAAALRETLCELNCTYGADDGTLFLTAACSNCDSYSHQTWYHYYFMVVLHESGSVHRVECKRDLADGRFRVESCPEELQPFAEAISQAVTCYRNKPATKAFEAACKQEQPDFHMENARYDDCKRLLARIPSCFGHLKERLAGNPLAEILEELIDVCEECAPQYGIQNTTFGEPATEEELAAWEKSHHCKLPEDLKDFLRFANGVSLPFESATIEPLERIGMYAEYMPNNYVYFGFIIGDGTELRFRKEDGEICEWDHETDEIIELGIDGLLEWIKDCAD